MGFLYRYLKNGVLRTQGFVDPRSAFDTACADLIAERTAPLDVTSSDDDVVYSAIDIYGASDAWAQWNDGGGPHPLDEV